jgi:hypothetical protein
MIDRLKVILKEFRLRKSNQVSHLAWVVKQILTDSQYRSFLRLRFLKQGGVHQVSNYTAHDRYPTIFQASQAYFAERVHPLKILSFGCSTGEEVFTLRTYFPEAEILGVDVNSWNLEVCRARNSDPRIHFMLSDARRMAEHGPFDAIFCMAVLQRSEAMKPNVRDSTHIYPFDRFDTQLRELNALLAEGGLLVLYHTSYRFKDTSIARHYATLPINASFMDHEPQTPKFDRHHRRLPEQLYRDVLFVKGGG